jgi:hypothetical protein
MRGPFLRGAAAVVAALVLLSGCGGGDSDRGASASTISTTGQRQPASGPGDIHSIRHVVIIVQENRSFDNYFGTYPGADGIPAKNGRFTVCVPDPRIGRCVTPFHEPLLVADGGQHQVPAAITDIDGGKMDVVSARRCDQCDGLLRRAGSPELLDIRPRLRPR